MTRPRWEDLEDVEDGNLLIRFLRPGTFTLGKPKGQRVQTSTCQSGEHEPSDVSYGASVFVEERLAQGVSELVSACPQWSDWTFVRLSVPAVRALALHVKYTPMDCTVDAIKNAHASLIGMTRAIRARLIVLLDDALDAL